MFNPFRILRNAKIVKEPRIFILITIVAIEDKDLLDLCFWF